MPQVWEEVLLWVMRSIQALIGSAFARTLQKVHKKNGFKKGTYLIARDRK